MANIRRLPSVDRVLIQPKVQSLLQVYSHETIVRLVRCHLDTVRQTLLEGTGSVPSLDALAEEISQQTQILARLSPQRVINATGVIIHTNLGRAPLSREAINAMLHVATGYSNVELNLADGQRGSRQEHVERLLCHIIGSEAALVVNNNASAILLGLAALASGKEVIVSRGEAVEIGGGFRIPEVLWQSGAQLVEVGTTNRTNVVDYENAITANTAALLRVHPSNFRITGFTQSATTEELIALGKRYEIPVLYDQGSGCILDTSEFGLAYEPTPQDSINANIAAVFFSGDKLLGGPQSGIVAGRRKYLERLARHPLARAMRIDKFNLAALSATLLHYMKGEARDTIPVWIMIGTSLERLESRAHQWASQIGPQAEVAQGVSTVGGGSLPGETLETRVVTLGSKNIPGGAQTLAARLRAQEPAIMARIEAQRVVIDPRTVLPEEDDLLVRGVQRALDDILVLYAGHSAEYGPAKVDT